MAPFLLEFAHMVAVISGGGLGWFNSSLAHTGRSHGGSAGLGQGNHSTLVNIATGNLHISGDHERASFNGLNLSVLRTYNSQGGDSDGDGGWQFSFESRLVFVAGGISPKGVPLPGRFFRIGSDGSETEYVFDASRNAYYSSDGDGASDFIRALPTEMGHQWVDGSTREVHTYDLDGRLTAVSDRSGNVWSMERDKTREARIVAISNANGTESIVIRRNFEGKIDSLETWMDGKLAHQVAYEYEYIPNAFYTGRLVGVRTSNLSGGGHFETRYEYESASSNLIRRMTNSDGTQVSFSYDASGRVTRVTQGVGTAATVLNYTYDSANRRTTVTDSANQSWRYTYDAQGRLKEVADPAVNGQRATTRYDYDLRGNLVKVEQGKLSGSEVFVPTTSAYYEYDSNDNLLWERDALGNSVQRTYNASNQLTSVVTYRDLDPDGANGLRPTQAMTSHFVYDSQDRLRYEISATGEVTQLSLNGAGQVTRRAVFVDAVYTGGMTLSQLDSWAAAQTGAQQIIDYTYDFRGLLAFEEQYAVSSRSQIDAGSVLKAFTGASVAANVYLGDAAARFTAYTYDPQGLLRQVITYRGDQRNTAEIASMAYDGMGRLTASTDALGRVTSFIYNDAAGTVTTVFGSGARTRVEYRDSQGRVIQVQESVLESGGSPSSRVSKNYYDSLGRLRASEDASGGRNYYFYDAAGRLETEVDATGAVTRYERDSAGRLLSSRAYAQRVNTSTWIAGGAFVGALILPAQTATDRVTQSIYDGAGRLKETVDGEGTRTVLTYDGAGRLVRSEAISALNSQDVRRTRHFYDDAGRLIGTLDAENYLTELKYDRAGQLIKTLAYATKLTGSGLETQPLSSLIPISVLDQDQITRHYYNGRGERIATLDAENFLSTTLIRETLNEVSSVRYAERVSIVVTDSTTLTALLNNRSGRSARTDTETRNAAGELSQSNRAGQLSTYSYDAQGRLLTVTEQDVDDAGQVVSYEQRRRLNGFGEVIAELPPEAAALITAGMTTAEIEAIWSSWAVKHQYDARGLRIQSTDAEGNRTWYFYNGEGQPTHTLRGITANINGVQVANADVEVRETTYNAFGQAQREVTYTGRLRLQPPYGYAQASALVQTLSGVGAQADTQVDYTYDRRGQLRTVSNPNNRSATASERIYNGFGELLENRLSAEIRGALSTQYTRYAHDKRGLVTSVTEAYGSLGLTQTLARDAFGRVKQSTDARGFSTLHQYDRLGRQVSIEQTVQGRLEKRSTTYDAFSRVLTETDALGRITTYAYQATDASVDNLRTTVTTAEGVVLTSYRNHRGLTLKVVDSALNTTRYFYDRNGQLVRTRAADNSESSQSYNRRGLLEFSTDASGRRVGYTYDAAGRVLTRTENAQASDPAEHFITRYSYDGQGRQLTVTDASGKLTRYEYDPAGNVLHVKRGDEAVPANGFEISSFSYDAQGRQLSVTQGQGASARTTAYRYDEAGRRIAEIVDPNGLKITTTYEYDASGNVIARHNSAYASGSTATDPAMIATPAGVTRMVYDEANRLVFSVDPSGAVSRYHYDLNGQLTATRRYAQRPALPSGTALTLQTVQAAVNNISNDAQDARSYVVRDRDGRERFVLDENGSWTRYQYNALGQRSEVAVVGLPADFSATERAAIVNGDVSFNGVDIDDHFATRFDLAGARRSFQVYDALGRLVYTLTPDGPGIGSLVTKLEYDAAGRVIGETQFGPRIFASVGMTIGVVELRLEMFGALAPENNRRTHYLYDGAGRLQYTLRETDYRNSTQYYAVSEQRYDGAGRVQTNHVYRNEVALPALSAAAIGQAMVGQTVAITRNVYDAAGRRTKLVDAHNNEEKFGYDAGGALVSYTDRENNTWTYTLDAAGRRIREKSPQATISYVNADGIESSLTRAVYTRTLYDALGNVVRRVEDENFEGLPPATFRTRVTEYVFDARGFQVQTRFPHAGQLDSNGRDLIVTPGATGPTQTVSYDALGRAVVQQDVRGNYSYKIYDGQGHLRYEIDQERYVTEYGYNPYGEQNSVVRYANPIGTQSLALDGTPVSLAQIQTAGVIQPNAGLDRRIDTVYDRMGRKQSVSQPAISYFNQQGEELIAQPRTQYLYNAFGELIQESVLLESGPNERWAHTYHWYDEGGRRVMTVDAQRYVTTWGYDARGLLEWQMEYARALADTVTLNPSAAKPQTPAVGDARIGFDRMMAFAHDNLGRRTIEALQGITTEYGYDKEGRLTSETRALGTAEQTLSTRRYDALGRLIELREPVRRVFVGALENAAVSLANGQHYAERVTANVFSYDAFGNATRSQRAGFVLDGSGNLVQAQDLRESFSRYDMQGRLVWQQEGRDASSRKISWRYYDAADNVTKEVSELKINDGVEFGGASANQLDRVITTFGHDGANRQTTVDVVRERFNGTAYQAYYRDNFTKAIYNAFGEISRREVWKDNAQSLLDARDYTYDQAGRLTASNDNAQGVTWRHGYNLAGHKVYERRPIAGGAQALFVDAVDTLGRATLSTLPRNTDAAGASAPQIQREFDRWGNVIGLVDARGFRTDYRYDHRNLVTREEKAPVRVVLENGLDAPGTGNSLLPRPFTQYIYDLHGRLTQTIDANGISRYNRYSANGDLQKTEDGEGHITYYAYNSVGEQVLIQKPAPNGDPASARGQVIYRVLDDRGRLIEQGDYLQQVGGGYARSMQQQFVLNQDGHRLVVTNGMHQSQRFTYNSRGEVTASRTAMGVEMQYRYDEMGRRVMERYASLVGAGRNEQTWDFDQQGRLIAHTDLGGRNYTYAYDQGLRTDTRIGGVSRRTVQYYESGLVKRIDEGQNWTTYQYDSNGNVLREENYAVDGGGVHHRALTEMQYDSNGRIETVTRTDLQEGKVVLDLKYSYDAVGNRRSVTARSGYGPGVSPITGGNPAPVFSGVPATYSLQSGANFQIDVAASDPNGDPITYQAFALVDGQERAIGSVAPWIGFSQLVQGGQPTARFTGTAPQSNAPIRIRLYATDGTSRTPVEFTFAVVSNTAPNYTPIAPQTAIIGQAYSLNVASAFSDAQSLSFAAVSGLPAGLQLSAAGLLTGTPAANTAGTYTVTVRATDSGTPPMATDGQFQLTVNATNTAPQGAIPPQTVNPGAWFSLNLANYFSDPDQGQSLTYSLVTPVSGLSISGATLSGSIQTPGSYTVRVRATDNGQPPLHVEASFQLTVNAAPVVLRPIDDVNSEPNTPVGGGFGWSIAGHFSDPDGSPLSFSAHWIVNGVAQALPAGLIMSSSGAFLGSFPSDLGSYRIRVTASDGASSAFTEFQIHVAHGNQPPRVSPVPAQSVQVGEVRSIYLGDYVSDPDSNNLTYYFNGAPAAALGATLNQFGLLELRPSATGSFELQILVSDGVNAPQPISVQISVGQASGQAPRLRNDVPREFSFTRPLFQGSAFVELPFNFFQDPEGGPLSYELFGQEGSNFHFLELSQTPNGWRLSYESENPFGAVVRIRATDAQGLSNDPIHDVRVILNVESQGSYTNDYGPVLKNGPIANITHAQGQPLSFPSSQWLGGWQGAPTTFNATGLPSGLAINHGTGVISGTPSVAPGTYRIRVAAFSNNLSNSIELVLTIGAAGQNNPPSFNALALGNLNASLGQHYSLNVAPAFSDPDGNPLSYSVVGSLPPGLNLSGTGVLSGTPTAAGNYSITVRATDSGSPPLHVDGSFGVTVQSVSNQAPVRRSGISSVYDVEWPNGRFHSSSLPLLFQDPEGTALTYEIENADSNSFQWVSISASGGSVEVSGELYGSASFRIRARDAQGLANDPGQDVLLNITVTGTPVRIEDLQPEPEQLASEGLIPVEQEDKGFELLPKSTTSFPAIVNEQTYWFTYDRENRVRIANGQLSNGAIQVVNAQWGWEAATLNVYDANGNVMIRATASSMPGQQLATRHFYDLRGQLVASTAQQSIGAGNYGSINSGNIVELRHYDNAGRLTRIDGQFAQGTIVRWVQNMGGPEPQSYDISGYVEHTRHFEYDDDGRLRRESSHRRDATVVDLTGQNGFPTGYSEPPLWVRESYAAYQVNPVAEAARQRDVTTLYSQHGAWQSSTQYYDGDGFVGNGYDGAGRLKGFVHFDAANGGRPVRYSYNYQGWDSWVESSVVGTRDTTTTTTTNTFDAQGRRVQISEQLNGSGINRNESTRYLAVNADGQILARRDGRLENAVFTQGQDYSTSNNPPMPLLLTPGYWNSLTLAQKRTIATEWSRKQANYEFVYVGGQQVASLQEDGRMDVVSRVTGFASSSNGTTQTLVSAGENLRAVAQRIYGTSSLWYALAAANGLQDDQATLTAGSLLNVPQVKTATNDAGTFKPYNPTDNAGSTLPNVPYIPPAPKASCNPLQIVMIVVAVVVTIYTAGAAAGAMGATATSATTAAAAGGTAVATSGAAVTMATGSAALAGGAALTATSGFALSAGLTATSAIAATVGGFAGSVASQLVGKALGVTDSFNLRQAVGSGLTAGLTAGAGAALSKVSGSLGAVLQSGDWRSAAAFASVNSLTGHAGARLAGLDNSFSWRAVAANAVTASVSRAVTGRIGQSMELNLAKDHSQFAQDLLSGAVGGVVGIHTRRAVGLEQRVDYGQVAADAFGNALGNALAGEHSRRATAAAWRNLGLDPSSPLPEGAVGRTRDGGIRWATGAISYPSASGRAGVSQLQAGPLEGFVEQDIVSSLLEDLNAMKISNPNFVGFRRGVQPFLHNRFVDYLADSVKIFGALGTNQNLDLDAQTLLAIQDGNDEFAVLRRAGLSSQDLAGLSSGEAFMQLRRGLLGTLAAAMQPSVAGGSSLLGRTRAFALDGGDSDAAAFLQIFGEGAEGLGQTNLLGDLAVNVPFAGTAVAAGQAWSLESDKRVLDTMLSVGLLSRGSHTRAISTANYNQQMATIDGPLALLGAGWVAKVAQGLDFALSSDVAEGAIGPKLSRAMSRKMTLHQYLNGEIQSLFHLDPFTRGNLFEDYVLQRVPAAQRFGNFPTIDWFDASEGLAISVKSVDLQAVSRLDPQRLDELLKGYVDKLSAFNGDRKTVNVGGVRKVVDVRGSDIAHRELVLGLEASTATRAQLEVLRNLSTYAAGLPNSVSVNLIPTR
jgi:YD repeat-containing protein